MLTSVVLSGTPDSFVTKHIEADVDEFYTDLYRCSFDILFKPPEPIAGKHCLMTVKNVALEFMTPEADSTELFNTYLVSMNMRQPSSFVSVNDSYPVSSNAGDGLTMLRGFNEVVGIVQPFKGFSNDLSFLVEVPTGPQVVTVTVQRARALYMTRATGTQTYPDLTELFSNVTLGIQFEAVV